ncbi:MAG: accessory Sec system protein Asp2 [Enterococcus sp.]
MKVKIVTMGSSVIKECFSSEFNPHSELFFDIVAHQNQISITSLMSEKSRLEVDEAYLKKSNDVQKLMFNEFNKSFLEKIKKGQPKYLVMDLSSEIMLGLVKISEGNYVSNNPVFLEPEYTNKLEFLDINEKFSEYFDLWKSAIIKFFAFLKQKAPTCKVVLLRTKFSDVFTDGSTLKEYKKINNEINYNVEELNQTWEKLDQYVITNFNVEVIDLTKEDYRLDQSHSAGIGYLNYERKFYNRILNELIHTTHTQEKNIVLENEKSIQRIYLQDKFELLNTKCIEIILNSEKNIIELSRKNSEAYQLYKRLLENDYILYFHKDGISKMYKRKYVYELWKRTDLHQVGDVFYTLDAPVGRKENNSLPAKKLIVIFPCMPTAELYDHHLMTNRMFPKFFDGIERSLVKNVYTMRIMDLNVSHGSHFINTTNNQTMEQDIIESIYQVKKELGVQDQDIVLYGASKGGTGALYYGSKLDMKCLAVDPIISLEEYNEKDSHFLKQLRKVDISEDINQNLRNGSSNKKYIIGSENVVFNYKYISKIVGENVNIINKKDEHITSHPDVSRNSIPEQLMLLNSMLLNEKWIF